MRRAGRFGSRDCPGIVGIGYNSRACSVQDGNHVALQVGYIVIFRAVVIDRQGRTVKVVGEIQLVGADTHIFQLAALIAVLVGNCTAGTLCPDTVLVVAIRPGGISYSNALQLSAVLPGVGTQTVGEHIADSVVGDGIAIVACQQCPPGLALVGIDHRVGGRSQLTGSIGIFIPAFDITATVIGPGVGVITRLVILPDQLVGRIVFVTGGIRAVGNGEDIAVSVVGRNKGTKELSPYSVGVL